MWRKLATLVLGMVSTFALTPSATALSPERWVQARSSHFVVLSDGSEKEARRVASQFERMHLVFHTLFPTNGDDPDLPITVVAVKDKKGLRALEPEAYLEKKQMELAGFFLRTADKNYILVRLDADGAHAYSTVYHEYTHYMLRKSDGWLPLWLNEGSAQFYENTDIDDKTAWLGETNLQELQYLKRNDMLPIETLLTIDAASPYYHDEDKGSTFYSESWLLTHYLIVSDRIQGTHRVRDYCDLLAQGEDSVTAAHHAFGDLNRLQAGLNDYVMQQRFMYFMIPAKLAAGDTKFEVRPVSVAEADAVRADILAYTRRTADAQTLLQSVLRDDSDNVLAHETMGYLAFRSGDLDGARNWYSQAIELDPRSYLAHYYYASLALHRGSEAEDASIESSLRTAISLNPAFAPAYDELAMLFALRRRNLDEAHELSSRAVDLEPGRLIYRLNCAELLAERQQFVEALEMLHTAMRLAKTPYEVYSVVNRTARVERYKVAILGGPETATEVAGLVQ